MRSGASGAELLAARDARQALVDRAAAAARGATLVAVALNVPGAEKAPPGARALHRWAVAQVGAALPGARTEHEGDDALGPFALLTVPVSPEVAKAACLAIEGSHPAGRLVDLDVQEPSGAALDRAALGLAPRPCLLCAEPARECMRLRRHPLADVVARARALLADAPA